ncbi:MAG: hypothetical protein ACR2NZ_00280 [Rubripirellula sp.]
MPTGRFVVLRHDVGPQFQRASTAVASAAHLDWMFEHGDALRTWSTDLPAALQEKDCSGSQFAWRDSFELPCQALQDHRIAYLTLEGDIGGGRGYVRRVLEGTYRTLSDLQDRTEISIRWRQQGDDLSARLCIYRSRLSEEERRLEESRLPLRLSFSTG